LSTFIYDTNLELSQKLDLLFLQKEEHLRQINVLQDQLAIILTNSQKKTALDATLEFFVNNSSFLVGLSVFLITFSLINLFGKSDFEVFSNNIIKAQSETHNSYITSTTEALKTVSETFLNDITKLLIEVNSLSMTNSDQKLEFVFNKLTDIDKINVEAIIQKLNVLTLKSQAIDAQILQILELLSK